MKKIKLITSALIGISALGLSGCGHQHTFDSKWESNNDEHWHPATCEHAGQVVSEQGKHSDNNGDGKCDICDRILSTHSHSFSADWKSDDSKHWKECVCGAKDQEAVHVDADHNGKCDVCEHDVEIVPAVTNVTVTLEASSIYDGESTTASANVTAFGGADPTVTWSSSDPSVATVDEEGNVLAIKKGTAKIIATSNFDQSKKGEATLIVEEDKGFDPSWLDEGFTYSKEFPADVVKGFLGEGDYKIVVPTEMLKGGAYYLEAEADAEGPACVVVIIDGALAQSYAYDLFDEGFDRVYPTSFGYEAVDPTGKYTVSMFCDFDEETYEAAAPTQIEFYKSADVWASSEKTSDVAWDDAKIINEDPDEIAAAKEWVSKVPFVALGEEYEIEYVIDDSMREEILLILEMFGLDVSSLTPEELESILLECGYTGPEYYLQIDDYSLCEPFGDYENVLLNAGFAHIQGEDEEGSYDYFEKNDGLVSYDLSFGFTEAGNTIYLQEGIAILEAFPVNEANDFIKDVLGSENSIVAYEETEGASFQAVIGDEEMDILVDYVDLSEAQKYANRLEELGFEVEYTPASDEDYPAWVATKGKLIVEFYLEQFEDEATESYLDEGPLYFFIYADPNKHEEKGIYLPESLNATVKAGSVTLVPELVKLGDSVNLTWTSSDEGVATVDADGVVTLLAAGEVNITVTTDVAIPEVGGFYSATTKLVVSEKPDFAPILADLNETLENYGGSEVLTADELPEIDCVEYEAEDYFLYYDCYVIWGDGTNETEASYAEKVEALGFEILEDEYGKYYETEEYQICFSLVEDEDEGDYFQIEIYFKEVAAEGATFDYSELTSPVNTIGDFTVDCHKTGGEAAPVIQNNEELRMYAGNALVISSDGEPITSIDFYNCDCTSKVGATFSADCGTLTQTDYGYHWEGNAEEVTFSCEKVDDNHKQCHFFAIEVNGGGEGGGGGGGQSGDIEDLCDEVSLLLFGEEGGFDYDSEFEVYYTYVEPESSSILDACSEVADILADVYFELQAPTEDEDEDGPYALAAYTDDNWEYIIQVVSFEDEGETWVEVDIYVWED